MVRALIISLGIVLLTGCSSTGIKPYKPTSPAEKEAFLAADNTISMNKVLSNFNEHKNSANIAWAGIIKKVQFLEKERSVRVGFIVEYHDFDWKKHDNGPNFKLSTESEGIFLAGWSVPKPTRISYLKKLAKPGDMIIVYGMPYGKKGSRIHIDAFAVHPISAKDFELVATP